MSFWGLGLASGRILAVRTMFLRHAKSESQRKRVKCEPKTFLCMNYDVMRASRIWYLRIFWEKYQAIFAALE
jgi:hypothetical protein